MNNKNIIEKLKSLKNESANRNELADAGGISVYPRSIAGYEGAYLFTGKSGNDKSLYIICDGEEPAFAKDFDGVNDLNITGLKKCPLTNANRRVLQKYFANTNPVVLGLANSFGFGDRLGLANAGHIRSLEGSDFLPILAQQSIRELTRTNRTPDEVMDAAVWAVFQEGYTGKFGADADHLKTPEDIDLMVKAGFRMFTFDPSEFVDNNADVIDESELDKKIAALDWQRFGTTFERLSDGYISKKAALSRELQIVPSISDIKRALVKYGNALMHVAFLFGHLKNAYPEYESEVEVSVDETESVTTPFEHYFIVNELRRLGVSFVSLAPRFIGDFEKGIDYKGDLDLFKQEYIKHLGIVKYFGAYKISLHSGSDKFSVYKVIGSISSALTHVKTAGTSYLEALKVTSIKEPSLFREILDYSRSLYENEKRTYHVSADIDKVKSAGEYSDDELPGLFASDDARQVLHVTFGKVVTDKGADGTPLFKDRLLNCLKENEETHYDILIKHFKKHLEPFA